MQKRAASAMKSSVPAIAFRFCWTANSRKSANGSQKPNATRPDRSTIINKAIDVNSPLRYCATRRRE